MISKVPVKIWALVYEVKMLIHNHNRDTKNHNAEIIYSLWYMFIWTTYRKPHKSFYAILFIVLALNQLISNYQIIMTNDGRKMKNKLLKNTIKHSQSPQSGCFFFSSKLSDILRRFWLNQNVLQITRFQTIKRSVNHHLCI